MLMNVTLDVSSVTLLKLWGDLGDIQRPLIIQDVLNVGGVCVRVR